MPVLYGGQNVQPVTNVTFTHKDQLLGDGRRVGQTVTAVIAGTIVVDKIDNVEHYVELPDRLTTIIRQQERIRAIFSVDGQFLEVQGWDGQPPTKFTAIVDSIEFDPGQWVDKCEYRVTLIGEYMAGEEPDENNHIETATENWQF